MDLLGLPALCHRGKAVGRGRVLGARRPDLVSLSFLAQSGLREQEQGRNSHPLHPSPSRFAAASETRGWIWPSTGLRFRIACRLPTSCLPTPCLPGLLSSPQISVLIPGGSHVPARREGSREGEQVLARLAPPAVSSEKEHGKRGQDRTSHAPCSLRGKGRLEERGRDHLAGPATPAAAICSVTTSSPAGTQRRELRVWSHSHPRGQEVPQPPISHKPVALFSFVGNKSNSPSHLPLT